jgi:hypothetical protein
MKSDPLNLNHLYPRNEYLLSNAATPYTYAEMARMDEENSQLALEASLLQECYMHLNYTKFSTAIIIILTFFLCCQPCEMKQNIQHSRCDSAPDRQIG